MALSDRDVINAPAFAGATVVAGHPPAQLTIYNKRRKIHYRRDETAELPLHAWRPAMGLPVPVAMIAL